MSLSTALTEWVLPLEYPILQQAWQHGQVASQLAETTEIQWRRYLNDLCLATVLPWIQAEEIPTAIAFPPLMEQDSSPNASPNPSPNASPNPLANSFANPLASWIPGTAIEFGQKRLILLPSIGIDLQTWKVPQEWVDIPAWAGDYFVAVRVDLDEGELQLLGYATHHTVKTQGQLNRQDRTYSLESLQGIWDMNCLWVVQQLNPTEVTQATIDPLPTLTAAEATDWLTRLRSV
ncbi:MAG: DUF1822 family protein, partial [Synechococcales bacterium]|nr:DUF1822 family protein [Synechococcales bacterium]